MTVTDRDFCLRAIAYIKASEPDVGSSPVELDQANGPVIKEIAEGLVATYVVETETQLTVVQHRHLEAAGLSAKQLHGQAVYNLAMLAQANLKVQRYGSIFAVLMGGNFEASLVLFPSLWSESLKHLAPNGYVAALPARDILAFTDAENASGIAELNQLCERVKGSCDHPLTQQLYSCSGSTWRPYG